MNTGEGLHRFVDPVDGGVYLYTQFETADAKRMFACFDQPDLKATYRLTVHRAAATGRSSPTRAIAESTEDDCRTARSGTTFATTKPDVDLPGRARRRPVRRVARRVPRRAPRRSRSGIYCRASLAEHMDAERLFTETKQGFDFYHRSFGVPYPFGKYDQCFVPEFNAGAMENAGCVTFLEDYVFRSRVTRYAYERRAETVLHEMAHMWFGDLVTMRWWDDLWLNESFATFASVLAQAEATEYEHAWTTFANIEKSWAYRQDQLPSTHPVAADIPDLQAVEVNFDGITYAKGASVLKQLVAYVGQEHFLAGLRVYFAKHAWGNADARRPARRAGGGVRPRPVVVERAVAGDHRPEPAAAGVRGRRRGHVHVVRGHAGRRASRAPASCARTGSPSASTTTTRRQAGPHAPGRAGRHRRAHRGAGAGRRAARQARAGQRRRPDLLHDAARPGLAGHADRPDRRHRRAAAAHAVLVGGVGDDPRGRAEGARLRDAGAATGCRRETEVGVVQRLLLQAQTAIGSYADPAWAPAGLADRSPTGCWSSRGPAEPGSDHQLALVNALAGVGARRGPGGRRCAAGSTGRRRCRAWSSTPTCAGGCCRRWSRTARPAEREIDEALTADPTATGSGRRSGRGRCGRPRRPRPRRGGAPCTTTSCRTRSTRRSSRASRTRRRRSCSAPYVERYFADVADVWARRSSERAQPVALGLFPSWSVAPSTVDGRRRLAGRRVPPAGPAPPGVRGPGRHRPRPGRPRVRRRERPGLTTRVPPRGGDSLGLVPANRTSGAVTAPGPITVDPHRPLERNRHF